MYFAKESEYNDIREKSFLQWLDEMEKHDDVAVRCGGEACAGIYAVSQGRKRKAAGRE